MENEHQKMGTKVSFVMRAVSLACSLWVALQLSCCAAEHGRIEGPPLYVHLCDAMTAADKEAWGSAAGDINAELGEPVLWVGNGAPVGCDAVDVCHGSPAVSVGECVVRVRYAPGSAAEVSKPVFESVLEDL